ncbi:MAG: PorT family protein [Gemmatimonadetes bacterium]|nr:PorT family protein [Gemmatimonadota bacterium]MYC92865.1 PorT family protein [Gemmatimonadota bacterium]MYJ16634.1 PorT family protein [Gemmatimonadota bacterium]
MAGTPTVSLTTMNGATTLLRALAYPALFLLFAGEPATGQVVVGVNGGLTLASLQFEGVELGDERSIGRAAVGATLALPASGTFGVRFGAAYVQKGAFVEAPPAGDFTFRLEYAEWSALAKARLSLPGQRVSLHALAGPTLGMELSCEVTAVAALQPLTIVDECADEGPDDRVRLPSKRFDWGVGGGIGAEVRIVGRMAGSLEVLYTFGLRSIYDGPLDRSGKHRVTTIQGGLLFSVG